MSKILFFSHLALFAFASLAFTGCGTDEQTGQSTRQAAATGQRQKSEDEEADRNSQAESIPPRIGMTKSEVRSRYGDPDSVISTPNGENWSYSFNSPAVLMLIPGYGFASQFSSKKNHHLNVAFGANGRVKTYSHNESKSALERWIR